jgi:amino acid transporter
MTKNMGTWDRVIRTLIAIVIGVLYFTDQISGIVAIVLGIVAIVFLLTSFVSWCPGYLPFNISTRKRGTGGGATGGSAEV